MRRCFKHHNVRWALRGLGGIFLCIQMFNDTQIYIGSPDDDDNSFEFHFEGDDKSCYPLFNQQVYKFCGFEKPLPRLDQMQKSIRRSDHRVLMDRSIKNVRDTSARAHPLAPRFACVSDSTESNIPPPFMRTKKHPQLRVSMTPCLVDISTTTRGHWHPPSYGHECWKQCPE